MRSIVTDTHGRTAWCVARSLARRGVEVVGLRTRASRFDRSRHFSAWVHAPALEADPEGWLHAARAAGRPGDVLLPVSIGAARLVAANHSALAGGASPPPVTPEQLDLASDKERTLDLARELGITAPLSFAPSSAAEAEKAFAEVGLPAVVKLREEAHFAPAQRFGIARDAHEFARLYRELAARQPRPLVQRYAPGEGVGVSLLASQGRLHAVFGHRRLREQMARGGPSTWCEPCDDPALEALAARFAEATRWNGVAMLEFRREPATGTLALLEVNPRFWGSLPLAIACGVDFPGLVFDWIRRGRLDLPLQRAVRRRRIKFPATDLVAACAQVAARPAAQRRAAARALVREWADPELRLGLVSLADPLVALAELREALGGARRLARLAL